MVGRANQSLASNLMTHRFLSAEWRHLVMLNYEIDPAVLQPLAPRGTKLDSWNGKTFVSLVGFLFLRTRVLGVPIPFHRNFEEVNLRFYVRRQTGEESRRGVVFIKEVAPRVAIALVARWCYNENYITLPMRSRVQLPEVTNGMQGAVEYGWESRPKAGSVRAEFHGESCRPAPGSEEEFITEHYWGYVTQRDGSTMEYRVEHPPWRVWRASEALLDCDVEQLYGRPFHDVLSSRPSSAFVADGSAVDVYRGERLAAATDGASA
jgi:uncharacterized protein YqjF (DUF2071 family)